MHRSSCAGTWYKKYLWNQYYNDSKIPDDLTWHDIFWMTTYANKMIFYCLWIHYTIIYRSMIYQQAICCNLLTAANDTPRWTSNLFHMSNCWKAHLKYLERGRPFKKKRVMNVVSVKNTGQTDSSLLWESGGDSATFLIGARGHTRHCGILHIVQFFALLIS